MRPPLVALVCAPLMLSGCFMHSAGPALDVVSTDAPGLAGRYLDDDGIEHRIDRIGDGLYRLRTPETEVAPEIVAEMRAMTGDCDALDDPDQRAECRLSTDEICAAEQDAQDRQDCLWMLGAMRGELQLDELPLREAALAESLLSLARGLPHHDDVVLAVTPLQADADWVAAQVLMIASHGEYSDFGIFEPQLLPLDILMLRRTPAGWTAYATSQCVEDADSPVPSTTALQILDDCRSKLAEADANRYQRLTRQAGPQPN
ncbi:MAG: hypothetical protein ACFB0F_01015 [Neomegalonema sp.]